MKHTILINKRTGMIEWLAPPPFKVPMKKQTRQRFSEVMPANPIKRLAFRVLRRAFGEEGRAAEWTRGWLCQWRAEILIGKHKGETFTHQFRPLILEWEREKWESK